MCKCACQHQWQKSPAVPAEFQFDPSYILLDVILLGCSAFWERAVRWEPEFRCDSAVCFVSVVLRRDGSNWNHVWTCTAHWSDYVNEDVCAVCRSFRYISDLKVEQIVCWQQQTDVWGWWWGHSVSLACLCDAVFSCCLRSGDPLRLNLSSEQSRWGVGTIGEVEERDSDATEEIQHGPPLITNLVFISSPKLWFVWTYQTGWNIPIILSCSILNFNQSECCCCTSFFPFFSENIYLSVYLSLSLCLSGTPGVLGLGFLLLVVPL